MGRAEPKGDRSMSRTDKTNPYFVKFHYERSFLVPEHRHDHHECNLPPRPRAKYARDLQWHGNKPDDPCFWWVSFEFWRSRWAKCCCPMCKRYAFEPDPSRVRRRAERRYLKDGWRDEY